MTDQFEKHVGKEIENLKECLNTAKALEAWALQIKQLAEAAHPSPEEILERLKKINRQARRFNVRRFKKLHKQGAFDVAAYKKSIPFSLNKYQKQLTQKKAYEEDEFKKIQRLLAQIRATAMFLHGKIKKNALPDHAAKYIASLISLALQLRTFFEQIEQKNQRAKQEAEYYEKLPEVTSFYGQKSFEEFITGTGKFAGISPEDRKKLLERAIVRERKTRFNLTVRDVVLNSANLSMFDWNDVLFSHCIFRKVIFSECNLQRAKFSDCQIEECSFDEADLQEAMFAGMHHAIDKPPRGIVGCSFREASLQRARFWNSTTLVGCNFSHANLTGAEFGAKEAIFIDDVSFIGAKVHTNNFNAFFSGTIDFRGANLRGSTVYGRFGLEGDISGSPAYFRFEEADIRGATIKIKPSFSPQRGSVNYSKQLDLSKAKRE